MFGGRLVLFALSAFGVAAAAVGSQSDQPACVAKCWANSQYVSNCGGDQKCLCEDAEFQNAIYQCLYSQCQTAQFGIALHHALDMCSSEAIASSSSSGVVRQGGDLRKRGYSSMSNSVTWTRTSSRASPTPSSHHSSQTGSVTYSRTSSRASPTPYTPTTGSETTPAGPTYSTQPTTGTTTKSTYTYSTGRHTTQKHTSNTQSVSAYQTYSTSRAYPTGSYSVLSASSSATVVQPSVSAPRYSSSESSTPVAATPTSSTTAPAYSTPAAYTAATSTVLSTISDGQVQATATPSPSTVESAQVLRAAWNTQRYPSDAQS